jgi:hypothetical protein
VGHDVYLFTVALGLECVFFYTCSIQFDSCFNKISIPWWERETRDSYVRDNPANLWARQTMCFSNGQRRSLQVVCSTLHIRIVFTEGNFGALMTIMVEMVGVVVVVVCYVVWVSENHSMSIIYSLWTCGRWRWSCSSSDSLVPEQHSHYSTALQDHVSVYIVAVVSVFTVMETAYLY